MARLVVREKFIGKIPDEFHKYLKKDEDLNFVVSLWKLDDDSIRTLFPSIPDKLKPIFDWKLNKPAGKRGNKSNIPYEPDNIKMANQLMKMSPGATITTEDDVVGALLTVQVLIKMQVGDSIKTVSISGVKEAK